VPDTFDWSNQVLDSLWWVTWVFLITVVGFALVSWLLMRYTRWGQQFARLAVRYFTPSRTWLSWRPILTVLLMLLLTVASVRIDVLATYSNNGLYTSLQELNQGDFVRYLIIFAIIATVHVIFALLVYLAANTFILQWRTAMNNQIIGDWLDGRAYYRSQFTESPVDNPDQRIQEDIRSFTTDSRNLAIGAVNSVVSLVSFSFILWQLSAPLPIFGVEIPRAMTFITYFYVIIASVIAFRIGRPLVRLNFLNEGLNASFRYALVHLRDNSEIVAFYRGEQVERVALLGRFAAIISNYWRLVFRSMKFQGFNLSITQIANIFPLIVLAPRFFSGAVKLGDLQQAALAFLNVHDSLSFFRNSYDDFAGYRATLNRLTGLLDVNDQARELPAATISDSADGLEIRNLTVTRPDGGALIEDLTLDLRSGDSLIVKGPSGSGKTSLLRSLAGLWPYASGTIHRPADKRALFLSQQTYVPFGSLRTALAYPEPPEFISDDQAQDVLRQVHLGNLVTSIDEDKNWSRTLSPGEQQRLGFARILINKPDVVFLDESTSALDEGIEHTLYTLIRDRLPECTLVSVGHRSTLNRLHSHELELLSEGRWTLAVSQH